MPAVTKVQHRTIINVPEFDEDHRFKAETVVCSEAMLAMFKALQAEKLTSGDELRVDIRLMIWPKKEVSDGSNQRLLQPND